MRGALDDVVSDAETLEWTARGGTGSRRYGLEGAGHRFHHVPDDALRTIVADVVSRTVPTAEMIV